MKTFKYAIFVFIAILILTSCANKETVDACLEGQTYGFLGGLIHGIIAPFDLIAMLFRDDVTVYAQNNNGAWYAFGFLLGILGGKSSGYRKKSKD